MNTSESTQFYYNIIDNQRPHSTESFRTAFRIILNHLIQNPNQIETSVTYPTNSFRKNDFKGYLSQSQILNCPMRFFGIEHDGRKHFPIFEYFGKFRNKV